MATPADSSIVQAQQDSLDDTDCYASVWNDILAQQGSKESAWGGRGKGGRGLARRTVQPFDVVVDVRLQYLMGDVCLEGANLKLLQGHVYGLVGKNGCGKSTLLQRMHAQKIPGWSTQWSSLYIPPELPSECTSMTPLQVILHLNQSLRRDTKLATESRMDEVQSQLDNLDMEQEPEEMERLCDQLSLLEDQLEFDQSRLEQTAREALDAMRILDENEADVTCDQLSRGQQKCVLLAAALTLGPHTNLMLLDEPSNYLDVFGLIQLRRLVEETAATVVLVAHDVDLINDVVTDIVEIQDQKLWYYPGNYDNYCLLKEQQGMHELRQSAAREKQRGQILTTLQHVKERPVPRRGGAKKKAKAVASQRKKLERHDQREKAATPHATASSVIAKKGLTAQQRLKLAETMKRVPDKAVQFNFPKLTSTWGEPLISALEIGHAYDLMGEASQPDADQAAEDGALRITKKEGFLFDCVDLCIEEGSRNCILGPSGAGKSTLLRILAKRIVPTEGTVHHASGIQLGYLDPQVMEDTIASATERTALEYLTQRYPKKTEQDLRGHLSAFGLSPTVQAKTPLVFLSSGEKCRFVMATIVMENPSVLCLDDPTLHLDVESVQALVYGLRQWAGTLVLVSSDANFLRSLEQVKCTVLMPEEGKLRRIEGGMDAYLKSFQL